MNEMTLTDTTSSKTWSHKYISSPFTETPRFGETDTEVLSGNIYTDYIYLKRTWTNTFGVLTDVEFAELWGFIERQYENNEYPLLTLSDGSATDVPVRLAMNRKDITNLCGDIENVTLTMIETGQNIGGG